MKFAFSWLLLGMTLLGGVCYLILASLLAAEFGHRDIPSYLYGVMLSMFAFASLVCSFVIFFIIQRLGRSSVLYIGLIAMSCSIMLMGLVTYVQNDTLMILTAIVLRFCQGFFRNLIQIPIASILIIINHDQKVQYLGYYDCMLNFGNSIGPVVGSILYSLVGYLYMFIIIGSLFLLFIPFMKITMPSGIDDNDENTSDLIKKDRESSSGNTSQEISYFRILSDPVIVLTLISQVLFGISFCYFEPVLSFRLLDFSDDVRLQGLVFCIISASFCIMSLVTPIMSKFISQETLISIGLFFSGLANLLIGPSTLLSDNLVFIVIGLFILGGSIAVGNIPQIPLMIQRSEMLYRSQSRKLTDFCTSVYCGVFSLGLFVGPIYGGWFTDMIGYRTCCDLVAIVLLLYSIIFFALCKHYLTPSNEIKQAVSSYRSDRNFESTNHTSNQMNMKKSGSQPQVKT